MIGRRAFPDEFEYCYGWINNYVCKEHWETLSVMTNLNMIFLSSLEKGGYKIFEEKCPSPENIFHSKLLVKPPNGRLISLSELESYFKNNKPEFGNPKHILLLKAWEYLLGFKHYAELSFTAESFWRDNSF